MRIAARARCRARAVMRRGLPVRGAVLRDATTRPACPIGFSKEPGGGIRDSRFEINQDGDSPDPPLSNLESPLAGSPSELRSVVLALVVVALDGDQGEVAEAVGGPADRDRDFLQGAGHVAVVGLQLVVVGVEGVEEGLLELVAVDPERVELLVAGLDVDLDLLGVVQAVAVVLCEAHGMLLGLPAAVTSAPPGVGRGTAGERPGLDYIVVDVP